MASLTTAEQLRLRRELRTEIARRRRQINASAHGLTREGRRLVSWRTHVGRHPMAALAGAFGMGMVLSAGLPRHGWLRWLAGWAFKAAIANVPAAVIQDAIAAFTGSGAPLRKS